MTCNNLSHLFPENNEGNVEYKWKLVDISYNKLHHLTTQMLYRLTEGNGTAEYYLGVYDNGDTTGISYIELNKTIENIMKCCKLLDVTIESYNIYNQLNNKYCYNLHISKYSLPDDKLCL